MKNLEAILQNVGNSQREQARRKKELEACRVQVVNRCHALRVEMPFEIEIPDGAPATIGKKVYVFHAQKGLQWKHACGLSSLPYESEVAVYKWLFEEGE